MVLLLMNYGKYRVIFDSSTQMTPDKVVLNQVTPMDHKATIDFSAAKTKLLTNIYNWHISFLNEVIYLALANITTCFCFPRILADIAGAFGFLTEASSLSPQVMCLVPILWLGLGKPFDKQYIN
jgi:hypothetical protein